MAAEEEVRLTVSMRDDISLTLERIEQRLEALDRQLVETGVSARVAGKEFAKGVDDMDTSVTRAGQSTKTSGQEVDRFGRKVEDSGRKTKKTTNELDKFAKAAQKMGREAGGLGNLLQLFKWPAIITGIYAAVGGISALGAGSVIAVAHLAPLLLNLLSLGPIGLAAALSMQVFKLTAEQLSGPLTRIKQQFTDIGQEVADGGLAQGIDLLASRIAPAVGVIGKGMTGIGAELGLGAAKLGQWSAQASTLAYLQAIFAGLRPIVAAVLDAFLSLLTPVLAVIKAILPASQLMADSFNRTAHAVGEWAQRMADSGRLTEILVKAWYGLQATGHALWNLLVGLFNIFRIGYHAVDQFGGSFILLTERFRKWTESAAGQQRIAQYFADSLPALREMGQLLGTLAGALVHIGSGSNVAPLLAQINAQLLPALIDLITHMTGPNGLGPALITLATALANFFTATQGSGALTSFALALAGVINGLTWLMTNVPGVSTLVTTLLTAMLAFRLLGPVWTIVGDGAKAFSWMRTATTATEDLTAAQKLFALSWSGVGTAAAAAVRGIGAAFSALGSLAVTPIGLIIIAIIAVVAGLVLLYEKCGWFRDFVDGVFRWIADTAITVWSTVSGGAVAAFDWIVSTATTIGQFFSDLWSTVSGAAVAAWNWIVQAVQTAVDVIVQIALAIWNFGIKPVLDVITAAFGIAFFAISFIVQTAVYIIIAIVVGIATALKLVWDGIVFAAQFAWDLIGQGFQWLYDNVFKPVGDAISGLFDWINQNVIQPAVENFRIGFEFIKQAVQFALDLIGQKFQWLYDNVIHPVIQFFIDRWNEFTGTIQQAVDFISLLMSMLWQKVKDDVGAVVDWISTRWSDFTGWLTDLFKPVGEFFSDFWKGISDAAKTVADTISGVWNGLVDVLKKVWNFIANGWNSIPDIHVPDWIPLIGGKTFGLPKLPTLWHGGEVPGGGPALVGEHGPEPLVQGGMVTGMVGLNGPEVRHVPAGGYVVPNLDTLSRLPGLAHTLPDGVARAVARAVPGYGSVVSPVASLGAPTITVPTRDDRELIGAVRELAGAVRSQTPPIVATGTNVRQEVLVALRQRDRENELNQRYSY